MDKQINIPNNSEKNFSKNIEYLKKNIDKLIINQDNLNQAHKKLIQILKKYYLTIDEANTTKKYYTEVSKKVSEINKNICNSVETIGLNKKLISSSKKLLLAFQKSIADNDDYKNFTIFEEDSLSTITKNFDEIKLFIEENDNLIQNTPTAINQEQEIEKNITPVHPISEKTLLISETQNKVILPYTLEELENFIKKNPGYNLSIEQVIDKFYTISLNNYKNSVLSRFYETYKLIRKKEHGSIKDALDLALEMAFNRKLHPAIITACNNINELDIYLACLEYDELEDFKFFNIRFEIAPLISKNQKALI